MTLDRGRLRTLTVGQRVGVLTFLVLFVGAEILLIAAVRTADAGEQQFVRQVRATGEATDIGFSLSQAMVDVVASGRLDADEVTQGLALARRHLAILEVHAAVPVGQADGTAAVDGIRTAMADFEEATAADPTDVQEGLAHLEAATRVAKALSDQAEQATFDGVLEVVDNNRARDRRTILVALVTALVAAGVLGSVTRRFRGAYQHAYDALVERTAQLESANDQLRAADRAKDRLVSVVSHELRTPLTAILGFAETLRRHGHTLDESRRDEILDAILRQGRRQQRLVDDLLTAARLAHDGELLAPVPTSVTDLLRRSADDLAVDLYVSGETARDVAWVDPESARRIVDNLLSNARKYGGPRVQATLARTRLGVVVCVEDDGPGVPPEFRDRVFEPFAQADDGDRRRSSGFGLGLAIARDLARASGGDLRLLDTHTGTAFELRLPAAGNRLVEAGTAVATELPESAVR